MRVSQRPIAALSKKNPIKAEVGARTDVEGLWRLT